MELKQKTQPVQLDPKEINKEEYIKRKANPKVVQIFTEAEGESVMCKRLKKNLGKVKDTDGALVECKVSKRKHHNQSSKRYTSPGPWVPGKKGFLSLYGKGSNAFAVKHESARVLKRFEKKSVNDAYRTMIKEDKFFGNDLIFHQYN